MNSPLTWTRLSPGHYAADGIDGAVYNILHTAERRWDLATRSPDAPQQRHGAAYTLREAKEVYRNFHNSWLGRQ